MIDGEDESRYPPEQSDDEIELDWFFKVKVMIDFNTFILTQIDKCITSVQYSENNKKIVANFNWPKNYQKRNNKIDIIFYGKKMQNCTVKYYKPKN